MPFSDIYQRQAALLVRIMPDVATEPCFALKGGTAINFFLRDMPRLSVDIDLTYLPVEPRAASLTAIDGAMGRIAERIRQRLKSVQIRETRNEGAVTRLLVRADGAQIKIEVTPVLRGCVSDPSIRPVSARVEDAFGFAEIQVVSFADLYSGKIVAALDRQHPRDLFDVRGLFENEGIDDTLRQAFLIYVLSSSEQLPRLLNPPRKDIAQEYERGFNGMTDTGVPLEALLETREDLISTVIGKMPPVHRHFLASLVRGEPDWSLINLPGAAELPAVRWRLQKLDQLTQVERAGMAMEIEQIWAG